jgi:hypothetical protein
MARLAAKRACGAKEAVDQIAAGRVLNRLHVVDGYTRDAPRPKHVRDRPGIGILSRPLLHRREPQCNSGSQM